MTRNIRWCLCVCLCPLSALLLAGCSKKADEKKPLPEVQAEAQKMDEAELKKMAESYKSAIADKRKEVETMAGKIKDIPLSEALGDKAKQLKSDLQELNASIGALTERANVYLGELKKKNVDVSGLHP